MVTSFLEFLTFLNVLGPLPLCVASQPGHLLDPLFGILPSVPCHPNFCSPCDGQLLPTGPILKHMTMAFPFWPAPTPKKPGWLIQEWLEIWETTSMDNTSASQHSHPGDHSRSFHALFRVAIVGTKLLLPTAITLAVHWTFHWIPLNCALPCLSPASWDSSLSQTNYLHSGPHLRPGFWRAPPDGPFP